MIIGAACITAIAAEIPYFDKQITIGPIEGYHRYYVHIYNADDIAKVKVNGHTVATIGLDQDSGWIEITEHLFEGDNTIELTDENGIGNGWAYGFDLRRDESIIWSDSCGNAGSAGCEYNDLTGGLVYRNTMTLKLAGVSSGKIEKKITLGPYSDHHRYYIHMYKHPDDIEKVKVNGKLIATLSFRQDSGWIDITEDLSESENTIELTNEYGPDGEFAYIFELKQNDSIIWSDSCGTTGSSGCKDEDITRGVVYRSIMLKLIPPITEPTISTPANNEQILINKPISTPLQESPLMNSGQKIGLFLIISGSFVMLWLFKKIKSPK
ncbi:MAG: hypothetical protein OIN87_07460 [Candidatus Methanoperedens sp.]|nr:hypothetical protein [Candidatus Methanoperedens sp.]